METTPRDL